MKVFLVLGLSCVAIWLFVQASQAENKKPTYVILTQDHDQSPREGMLIEIKGPHTFELDSGTLLSSMKELDEFLQAQSHLFAPRLILSSNHPDVAYYHTAMEAMLLLEKNCPRYSCLIKSEAVSE